MSSGANKPFYDRDDLDEEEKKLFDAMVIEEMEKLEKQFDSTSFENSRRDRQIPPSSINTDLNTRNSADDRPSYGRDRPSNASHQSEPTRNYPADYGSNDSSTIRSEEQPTRRVPRSSVVAENYPRPNEQPTNGMPFSPEKSNADKRYKQQEYARLLEEGSRPPNEGVDRHAVSRVARREESPPASRCISAT